MHFELFLFLLATTASLTHAAPTPTQPLEKRSFKVPVKGHKKLSPADAMAHAYRKHGFDISNLGREHAPGNFFHDFGFQSSSAVPWWDVASSSVVIVYGSSGFSAFPSASASAIGSGAPFSYSAFPSSQPLPFSSGVPSSGAPSGAPSGGVPSSGAPSSRVPSASGPLPSSAAPSSSAVASSPPPSSSAPSSGGGTNNGGVTASPEPNDVAYLAPVSIGGQTLNLDFDTGSSDMWVFNTGMPSSESSGHTLYDPSKSSTFTPYNGGSWMVKYGDGSTASGSVGFDTVNIGGVVASKQCVELAETVTGNFLTNVQSDGLLGLGFSNINTVQPQQQQTFWENVLPQLDQPLFTANLEEDATGTYEFGAIDTSKFTGSINYTPVDKSNGWWQFDSPTYSISGTQHACTTCSPAIADTGTSLILMDDDVVKAYYQQVSGAQFSTRDNGYEYPCGTTLPDFGIAIGSGYTATIKGSDLTYISASSGSCFGGLQPNNGAGVNVLGDVFLKQFFVVFDGGNMQLGVAAKP